MTPESLTEAVGEFLANAAGALVTEDGEVSFDLSEAKYSISGESHKCLIHLWSAERNVVRRVLDAETRNEMLRLTVQRLGQSKPTTMEICRERDRRVPSERRKARLAYQRALKRVLERRYPVYEIERLSSSMDLGRSFGPIYTRGVIRQGQSAFAVLGVNEQEAQAAIDAALTFAILWLDCCRENYAGKLMVEGLKLFLPRGTSQVVRERMFHLQRSAAKWQLYEFDEHEDLIKQIEIEDRGNLATRLVRAADESSVHARFAQEIAWVRELMSEVSVAILSPAEVSFRCRGLEFAKARLAQDPRSFSQSTEILFGVGREERLLSGNNQQAFRELVCSIGEVRHAQGPKDHPFWRRYPERWLESLVVGNLNAIDTSLRQIPQYSQVPAFSSTDRAMIDVLSITREGRLAVLELKADEDIHLPLQGLDYWSRVAWHHARGEFQGFGYFAGCELSARDPLLILVAPALRIHSATDTLLRYISKTIDWKLIAIDERWRENPKPVFRKHSSAR